MKMVMVGMVNGIGFIGFITLNPSKHRHTAGNQLSHEAPRGAEMSQDWGAQEMGDPCDSKFFPEQNKTRSPPKKDVDHLPEIDILIILIILKFDMAHHLPKVPCEFCFAGILEPRSPWIVSSNPRCAAKPPRWATSCCRSWRERPAPWRKTTGGHGRYVSNISLLL